MKVGTLSQVTINNRVGEKSTVNASLIVVPTCVSRSSSLVCRKSTRPPKKVSIKSQKGEITTSFVERGKERGLKSRNGNLKDITPTVLTCNKGERLMNRFPKSGHKYCSALKVLQFGPFWLIILAI